MSERSPYLCARASAGALGPLRSAQSVPSLPLVCVNAALFLKILSSVLPPSLHFFQAAYRRPWLLFVFVYTFISLLLKFNLLFGNVVFEKHDSFILYFMYRLLLLYDEVPIDVAVEVTNKELVSLSLKKVCRSQLQKN